MDIAEKRAEFAARRAECLSGNGRMQTNLELYGEVEHHDKKTNAN